MNNSGNVFQLVSKYRTLLMGIGVIDVFLVHYFNITDIDYNGGILNILSRIPKLVYTPGFLLLSGFGLFFSFQKSKNLWEFYRKRINRIVIPFLLISVPFFTVNSLLLHDSFLHYLGNVTTINYWISGNYMAMWYIAVTIVLYLLYPLLEQVVIKLKWGGILTFMLLNIGIHTVSPAYGNSINLALSHTPMFMLGILMAYYIGQEKHKIQTFLRICVCFAIVSIIVSKLHFVPEYLSLDAMAMKLIYIPVICVFFYNLEQNILVAKLASCLEWLGRYSFELYVLHVLIYFAIFKPLLKACYSSNLLILLSIIISLLSCKYISLGVKRIINCNK